MDARIYQIIRLISYSWISDKNLQGVQLSTRQYKTVHVPDVG